MSSKKQRKAEKRFTSAHLQNNPNCFNCEKAPSVFIGYDGYGNKTEYPVLNEVHHLKPICEGGSHLDGLITLCGQCHREIHTVEGKLKWSHINPKLTNKYKTLLGYESVEF